MSVLKKTGWLIDSNNNPYWAWLFFTPEALNKSNRRWSPAKREAKPAEAAVQNDTAPAGAEQTENMEFPIVLCKWFSSTPAGVVRVGGLSSAGSASRSARLHRRLFLLHASGVETLANDPNLSLSANQ